MLSEELAEAVSDGDENEVRALLARGADPNAVIGILETPVLMNAVEEDQDAIAGLLLEAGADPNAPASGKDTAVVVAAREGKHALLRQLLDRGGDPNRTGSLDWTPLQWCLHWSRDQEKPGCVVRPGYPETVRLLLERGADPNVSRREATAPLVKAASQGSVELVALLLEAGADPASGEGKESALFVAASRGEGAIVRLLAERSAGAGTRPAGLAAAVRLGDGGALKAAIAAGLDVNDGSDGEPLVWAVLLGDEGAVRELLRAGARTDSGGPESCLGAAIRLGHDGIAVQLLEAGANPNVVDEDPVRGERSTPLVRAAARGSQLVVSALLSAGADVDGPAGKRAGAFLTALRNRHPEVARALFRAGARRDLADAQTLAWAATLSDLELVRDLLAAGADPKADRHAALSAAIAEGQVEAADALLLAGGDANAVIRDGDLREPLLVRACRKGQEACVRLLLSRGARPDAKASGRPALHWALFEGHAGIVRTLVQAGARLREPLFAALASGNADAVAAALAKGASPDLREAVSTRSALSWAAMLGYEAIGILLLEKGATPDGAALVTASAFGRAGLVEALLPALAADELTAPRALQAAAEHGHAAVITRLLAAGVDPDARADRGASPLMAAAREGHIEAVRALLAGGADPAAKTPLGMTAADEAELARHDELAELLREAAGRGRVPRPAMPAKPLVTEKPGPPGYDPQATATLEGLRLVAEEAELVRRLLAQGADPNARLKAHGVSAVQTAAVTGAVEIVRDLLRAGADARAVNENGTSALHTACGWKHQEVATALLEAGADPFVMSAGRSPFFLAALAGMAPVVRLSLSRLTDSRLALLAAVGAGDAARAAELLGKGTKATLAEPTSKWPALSFACLLGEAEVAQALLDAGADVNLSRNGWTPLALACRAGSVATGELLLARGAQPDVPLGPGGAKLLLHAVFEGRSEIAERLLAAGASIEGKSGGRTPLFLAAQMGARTLLGMLIERGAAVDAKDEDGRAPLAAAIQWGHLDAARILLDAGARPDAPLRSASVVVPCVSAHRRDALELLLARGATGKGSDMNHNTALHLAAREGDVELVSRFVSKASLGARNDLGRTPLHEAAWAGSGEVVERLLAAGASPSATDAAGLTAIDVAALEGDREIVSLLHERCGSRAGANAALWAAMAAGMEAKEGAAGPVSPLVAAVRMGRPAALAALLEGGEVRDARLLEEALRIASREGETGCAELLLQAAGTIGGPPRDDTSIRLQTLDAASVRRDVAAFPVVHHGALGAYREAPPELVREACRRAQLTSDRFFVVPFPEHMDGALRRLGYEPLGDLVCDRLSEVLSRFYGRPGSAAAEPPGSAAAEPPGSAAVEPPGSSATVAFSLGLFAQTLDVVSAFADGSYLTTTAIESAPAFPSRSLFARSLKDGPPFALARRHEVAVRHRAERNLLALPGATSLAEAARLLDGYLARRFEVQERLLAADR